MNLGTQLREIRKNLGWTQSELANRCGVTLRTIQRIEKGDVTPSAYTLGRLKKELGTDFFELKVCEEKATSNPFSNFEQTHIMQAVFSLFLSKTFPRSALILLAIGLIGFGLSKSIFSITGLDPSRSATVNTTNCGFDTECDILLTVKDNKGKILV